MTTTHVFGRGEEMRVLAGLIERIGESGSAVLLLGEAGIGKSTLLRAVAERGRAAGFHVLKTIGVEAETQVPFAGLHRLLRPILRTRDALPATQRRALMSAFGDEGGPPPEPFMIAMAALNLLAEVAATRPVMVVVDDVQWLDRPTHEALAFVARRVSRDPIIVVGAVRKGHAGPFAAAGLREMEVPGLDDASAREVLGAHAADLSLSDRERILGEALGNPLALVELPAAWRAAGERGGELPSLLPLTTRLERAFAGRVAELPGPTRDAVLIAAVDSVDELPEILAAASVLAGRPVNVDVLDSAAELGLLRFDEMRVTFRHPLVRSGVLHSETVARRQAANAALAAVLEDQPYRRIWHRAQSIIGPDDEIADELEVTHAISVRRGSVTAAIRSLERSAQLTTDSAKRGRRLLLAAEHAFGLGRADMVDHFVQAAARTDLSELDRARSEWLREIFNDGVPGDATRVFELCDFALRSAGAGDTDLALNLLLGASLRCWWADAGTEAGARVAGATRRLRDAEDDPRYVAALATAEPVREAGAARDLLSRVTVETVADAAALRLLGQAAHAIGEPVLSVDFLDRSENKLREQGRLGLLSHVLTMQILDRVELGEWGRALAAVEEGRRLAQDTGQPIWDTGSLVLNAVLLGLRGDNERAQAMAREAEQAANGRRLTNLLACVQLARGYGWIGVGRHAEAYDALRPLFDPGSPCFHQAERFHAVMFLAEAAVHAGRCDDARSVIADLESVAAVTPAATLHVHLSYARAVLADDDEAEELFLTALGRDLVRWPWAKARLDLAYGSWLRRRRRIAESRAPLRSAMITFDVMGANHWAEQARFQLRASGERAPDHGPAAQDALSAQELQIARLAAAGLSNREIGQRLYLSPRTVGSHLYRIFPKLNITSRSQLASRLDGI
ncbi:AAA family ATPase [Planotetraspora sp. A-T 1434]|uniref:AAA family ATPase n=1 Tax=Planotetraspora sp. A-T 1434 TaxID=2979219 RepID=UPI0021C133EB|nr:LuxR family transcriptional regulator [Planotetraspora sp. A-T 1434]MCT9930759.1 AAA family ATPase [Planotetraspora sp. A-T 1434]